MAKEAQALLVAIKAGLTQTLELFAEFGPDLGRRHTAPLERSLYEI